jgi:heavy metal sensor kinase
MPSRLPLRLRVALAFAVSTAVALVALGAFVYFRVDATLEKQLRESLDGQMESLLAHPESGRPDAAGQVVGEALAQVLTLDGEPVGSSGQVIGVLASRGDLPARDGQKVVVNRVVELRDNDATENESVKLQLRRDGDQILVVGTPRDDADDALDGVRTQLLIGGPLALLLASLLGYLVAGTALRPIERMRSRAASISSESRGERLPLPEADDEVRRLGVTLNAMLDRLDEGMQRERRFVAEASHELRTPLALLRVELDLALSRARTNEELVAALDSASDEVDRLTRLARDLLVLASSDEERLLLEPSRFDLGELLRSVTGRFAASAEREGRNVRVAGDFPLPVDADRERLDQVLGNLLDNALRHGGGEVVLEARQQDGQVLIRVSDEGPGLPAAFREHAFDRFSRAGGTRADGRGLGLAIVRAIVRAHGGEVSIDDRGGGNGTVVSVRLPADDEGAGA